MLGELAGRVLHLLGRVFGRVDDHVAAPLQHVVGVGLQPEQFRHHEVGQHVAEVVEGVDHPAVRQRRDQLARDLADA